jgi:hypothetical protein
MEEGEESPEEFLEAVTITNEPQPRPPPASYLQQGHDAARAVPKSFVCLFLLDSCHQRFLLIYHDSKEK